MSAGQGATRRPAQAGGAAGTAGAAGGEGPLECQSCGEMRPRDELDRYLWCPRCVAELGRRAGRWGRFVALGVAGGLAIWVAAILPAGTRLGWLWAAPVLIAYVLIRRIAETIAAGAYRARGL